MSDSFQEFWSNDPYAPKISTRIYYDERLNFAGFLIGSIFYGTPTHAPRLSMLTLSLRSAILGVVIVLFFRCMGTLPNPVDRTSGIKWGFAVHTAVMFSIATVFNADNLALQSLSYINNREYPGDNDGFPGPYNYQYIIYNKPIAVVPAFMLPHAHDRCTNGPT